MTAVVCYELEGPVAWLTIDRPEARNALSAVVRAGLWAGVRRFCVDDDAAVLVLTGAGDQAFCAGGDLRRSPRSTASPTAAGSCSRRTAIWWSRPTPPGSP